MNLILVGMPGSGKGTQAKLISEKYKILHISTGDIFREVLRGSSPLAEKIRKAVDSGMFVSDEIVLDVIKERLGRKDCEKGFLLDGFPRNLNQAETFDGYLDSLKKPAPKVIYLELPFEAAIKRLTARRFCPVCKKDYNLLSSPPARDEICDACGNKLASRKDDERATIENRLKVFEKETIPLIDYYGSRKRLLKIDADRPVEKIFMDITVLLSSGN